MRDIQKSAGLPGLGLRRLTGEYAEFLHGPADDEQDQLRGQLGDVAVQVQCVYQQHQNQRVGAEDAQGQQGVPGRGTGDAALIPEDIAAVDGVIDAGADQPRQYVAQGKQPVAHQRRQRAEQAVIYQKAHKGGGGEGENFPVNAPCVLEGLP